MGQAQKNTSIDIPARQEFINNFPCFSMLSPEQSAELAALMETVVYQPGAIIVNENDLVDCIYIIVSGEAEVTNLIEKKIGKKKSQVPVATLNVGEAIGLNDMGFYSATGKRTATVKAVTEMHVLKLSVSELNNFLTKENLIDSMQQASQKMLHMKFIKKSLPFAKISHERLNWLVDKVNEVMVPAGKVIFDQNDQGECCYLIRSGKVEITVDNQKRVLAELKAPAIFGEATLITRSLRNASAKTLEDTELLVLNYEHLSELLESEDNVASMFMTLMVDRSRPIRNASVSMHERVADDGREIIILKNPDSGSYFSLSDEGVFIWSQLDGNHTMQEITLDLAEVHNVFAPDMVVALIARLAKSGFIKNVKVKADMAKSTQPLWVRFMSKLSRIVEARYAFGDSDPWLSRMYERYVKYLFTKPGKILLMILAFAGFCSFVANTDEVLLFFHHHESAGIWLLLALLPFSIAEVCLHEFGHAFAVKACGREVHYFGVGWFWVMPIAFTDTSDMWLADRKQRIMVNLAGSRVDVIVAGIASLFIFIIPNPYIQALLWMFALYTYVWAFRMMSPMQDMDGYYVLMDWVEKNSLRQSAVLWLVKKFPKAIRHPKLFKENKEEAYYWLACLIFLILVMIMTLVVQGFVFKIIGIQPANPYVALVIPLTVVFLTSLSIIADIRNQPED